MDKWQLVFLKGATYEQRITLTGVSDIASATEWRVRVAQPNTTAFLTATIANGMIVDATPPTTGVKILRVPAATTATFPIGNARFDFEVDWTGGVVRRYYENGEAQVNPKVGT
jgi:hypothetical protein